MILKHDFSLKEYNGFGVETSTKLFCRVTNSTDLQEILADSRFEDAIILGGGTNTLFVRTINKPVIKVDIGGIRIIEEDNKSATISVGAGVDWHYLVMWCLERNLGGLENLSLIPGNAGTAPIQNIGAYGVELKDLFVNCVAINVEDRASRVFHYDDCEFGYRDSIFKNQYKGKYVITTLRLILHKNIYNIHSEYGTLQQLLNDQNLLKPTIHDVARTVIQIRKEKLPHPKTLGNCGSFFKNPVINRPEFELLQNKFPNIPFYSLNNNLVKVPAGWLIEQAGFKGHRKGDTGMHVHQALVLVNYNSATGNELWAYAKEVQRKVKKLFHVHLEPEVNIVF